MKNKRRIFLIAVLAIVTAIAFWPSGKTPDKSGNILPETEIKQGANLSAEILPEEAENSKDVSEETGKNDENPQNRQSDDARPESAAIAPRTDPSASENEELTCTLSVRCDTVLNNLSLLKDGKEDIIPKNGVIFATKSVKFNDGETVFNLLVREMKLNKIHLEFTNTPIYNSAYIEGIGNLYEFDCGELSGWMYRVNGVFPNYGCSEYRLKKGDKVEWVYSCDLGKDVGGQYSAGNGKKYETQ